MNEEDFWWEPCGPVECKYPTFMYELRVRPAQGSFTAAELDAPMVVLINHDEIWNGKVCQGAIGQDGSSIGLPKPLLAVQGMNISLILGRGGEKLVRERKMSAASAEEAMAWAAQNLKDNMYPARWFGTSDLASMKRKLDGIIDEAKKSGLVPVHVDTTAYVDEARREARKDDLVTPGAPPCAICWTTDPERGPYHVRILSNVGEPPVFFFTVRSVCGFCAEDPAIVQRLIDALPELARNGSR